MAEYSLTKKELADLKELQAALIHVQQALIAASRSKRALVEERNAKMRMVADRVGILKKVEGDENMVTPVDLDLDEGKIKVGVSTPKKADLVISKKDKSGAKSQN